MNQGKNAIPHGLGGEFPHLADSGGFWGILFSYYKNVKELAEFAIK
jgi:hypothetical protein